MKRQWKIGLILVAEEVTIALAARAWQRWYCKPKQKTYDDEIQELVDKGYTKKAASLTLFNRMRENDPYMRFAPRQPSPESKKETYGHNPQCDKKHEWYSPCNREALPRISESLQKQMDSVPEEDRVDLSQLSCTNCGGSLVQISRDQVWCRTCCCDGTIDRPVGYPDRTTIYNGPHQISEKHGCGISGVHWHGSDPSKFYRGEVGTHWKVDGECRIIIGRNGESVECGEHSFGEVADDGA